MHVNLTTSTLIGQLGAAFNEQTVSFERLNEGFGTLVVQVDQTQYQIALIPDTMVVVTPIGTALVALLVGLTCVSTSNAQFPSILNLPALVTYAMFRQASPLSFEQKKEKAVAFVREQMQQFSVPGMALAVVHKNEAVLTEGYGTKQYGRTDTPVTSTTQFQVGSVGKTFIAVCIAKLVDDGKVQWTDRVKQHLPWTLMDKYAEEHTTLADLLAMNSVFGSEDIDFSWLVGVHSTEEEAVEALARFTTTRLFRAGWEYSNINYEVLGQVVAAVTKQTWFDYLHKAILEPLGMHDTVAFAAQASPAQLSAGHLICHGKVNGPFDLLTDVATSLPLSFGPLAAGSIVSTAVDMAKFTAFLLNKGDGLFKSPSVIAFMTTGHEVIEGPSPLLLEAMGYFSYKPDGNVVGAGYGFDFTGHLLFGKDYFSKNGETMTFMTETSFVPSHELGLVLFMNAVPKGGDLRASFLLAQIRSYVLGLYLDIPESELMSHYTRAMDHIDQFSRRQAEKSTYDGHVFDGKPLAPGGAAIASDVAANLIGAYTAVNAFYGHVNITAQGDGLLLQYGKSSGPLVATEDPSKLLWDAGVYVSPIKIEGPGRFVMQENISFVRQ
ncbi:Aste57867_20497 [Aphanomyces stellatus]|uniref:Aste57867_20497 protein n=1 Tax=Aphanomyces stellatus TaxID=120398 RepID=A0A485LGB0_9STRA|nr:hypothetical protein As57867_020431 [Aphanomyces stellatus]VFT97182.1 Aste57867_20497 [Aphanomyces stellatus]